MFPALETLRLSFLNDVSLLNDDGEIMLNQVGEPLERLGFIGFANYAFVLISENFWLAMRNTAFWLLIVPSVCIVIGMAIAVLAESVRWGTLTKNLIFILMAISFVGAAVIWRFLRYRCNWPLSPFYQCLQMS